ncbi:MAG: T9SS type A sorting domain-containing protein [Saprospiraceae bacterium]|nr:T9SS type A sorting domain-containing protein [Saprospiraceae bacterium]
MHAQLSPSKWMRSIFFIFLTLPLALTAQPENDDPCPTDPNPPIDLTSIFTHVGTTCDATFDYPNLSCDASTEGASVWYTFTPSSTAIGYDIILEGALGGAEDANGDISMEVYKGSVNQGCTGFTTAIGSRCTTLNVALKLGNDFDASEIMYIKITTDISQCGEFNLTIMEGGCIDIANTCNDITAAQTLNPETLDDFQINYNCVSGCIDYGTPDLSATGGCMEFLDNPTVWYQVNVDDMAQQLLTYVSTNGIWSPVWSIYGGSDCGDLTIISNQGMTCSNEDTTPDLFQVAVDPVYETYWIAVSYDPSSIPPNGIIDGTFEVCASTTINAIICLGDIDGGCAEPSLVIEVTERENPNGSLDGPFCPGEEVSVSVSFTFDASETSSDWLSGIIPKFGPGWDLTSFDYEANAPFGNSILASWYEEEGDCAPIIQEDVSHLCTYTDENGNLVLCNTLCEPCSECPSVGMNTGDALPSGYFWVTTGAGAGCDNDCSPGEGWGIGSTFVTVDWDFELTVKEFDTFEECFENRDLQISFQSFSQGLVGCWEDPIGECLIDKSQFGPLWEIGCEAPSNVIAEDQEICYEGTTDIDVQTEDGSINTIIVEFIDNPNVSGENNYTFPDGFGTITDNLLNLTNTTQYVGYKLYAEDPALICDGNETIIEVSVHPELTSNLPQTISVCEGECKILQVEEIFGGNGGPYLFEWSNGETSPEIEICPTVLTTYSVTVTDELGCSSVSQTDAYVVPSVDILLPETLVVCKDDEYNENNPEYIVCLDFLNGTPPYQVTWNIPPGLITTTSGSVGECLIINEAASSEFGGNNSSGEYFVGATVTDNFFCSKTATIIVKVTGELTMVLEVNDLICGETEAEISASGFDTAGQPLSTFYLYGGCPNDQEGTLGDFLEEISPTSGIATFPTQDLLSYTCYQVVGLTNDGCQIIETIEIPLVEGTPIQITGTDFICAGEEATITIENAADFTSFVWTPDIGNTATINFSPDTTQTYFIETTDANGCLSQEVFTVNVEPENSPLCTHPCENQTAEFQITGIAYADTNGNGIQDAGESPLSNVLITDVDNNFSVFTNVFGVYVLPVEEGEVGITAFVSEGAWEDPEIGLLVIVQMPCVENVNFGFVPAQPEGELNISVTNSITRCDFETKFYITVENYEPIQFNGFVLFYFDDKTSFFSSDIPDIQVSNNVATFNTGPIPSFSSRTYTITLKMPGGTAVLPTLSFDAILGSEDMFLDEYAYTQELRCSYDPNDKRTHPDRPGEENFTLKEEMLQYVVRFQNNGNDTAFHVRIVDVIDPHIIKESIRFLDASHAYTACITEDTLIIDFDNINLLDSMTNYEASQGYVSFSCQIDPTVEVGDQLFNTADILFDSNPAIVTNTTLNTIVDMLCTPTSADISETICLGDEFMGYTEDGLYSDTLTSVLGCDSILNIALDVIEPNLINQGEFTVCQGEDISILGSEITIDTSGIYTIELDGPSGCIENIVTITVVVNVPEEIMESYTLCDGESIVIQGTEIDSSGSYTFEVEGASGCIEQIINATVDVVVPEEVNESFTVCAGDVVTYEGEDYEFSESGNYVFEIFDEGGCLIQVLTFEIDYISITQNIIEVDVCEGVSISYQDQIFEFDSSGTYTYLLEGASGCNELEITFDVHFFPTTFIQTDTTICEGQSYAGFEESGTYTVETFDPETGCLIEEIIELIVLPASDPDCLTDVEDIDSKLVKVYPIPTSDELFIESNTSIESISIFSSTGKLLQEIKQVSSNTTQIDASRLPVGFHFIMLETPYGRIMKKVVINR